jgi:hypothetical protein
MAGLFGLLALAGRADAQAPNSAAMGGAPGRGGYQNPIPPGADPYATPYANPYTSPYAAPYLNPYWMMNTDPNAAGLMYFLAAQRAGHGIGSGRLGGPRAAETFGPRPEVASGVVPPPASRLGADSYFQRPLRRNDRGRHYYQRSYRQRP